MQEGQASWTATYTAISRAAHQCLDAAPKILDDPVAIGLIEGAAETDLRAQADTFRQPVQQHTRAILVLRSRYAEDRLAQAVAAGATQYVILGAGLDTFAYRQPAWVRDVRVIEVDHPDSQALKRHYLQRRRVAVPANVVFCPIDFERATLRQGLEAIAFDPHARTFLSLLGVTQYLTREALAATLRDVLTLPAGSGIVLAFVLPDAALTGVDLDVSLTHTALAASHGEPWLTRFEPEALRAWLLELGFSTATHLAPSRAQQLYFAGRNDGLHAPRYEQLMYAEV